MNVFEKIIEKLEELQEENTCGYCRYRKKCNEVQEKVSVATDLCGATMKALAIEIVKEVAEEHNNGWILCSERMPEEHDSMFAKWKGTDKWRKGMFAKASDDVIVTVLYKDGEVRTTYAHTIDGKWSCDLLKIYNTCKIIAWQPLPEPYKPKGEKHG